MLRRRLTLTALVFGFAYIASGCQPVQINPSGSFEREVQGGRFLTTEVTPFTSAANVNVSELFPPHSSDLSHVLGRLEPTDFVVANRIDHSSLSHVTMRQAVNGVPIHGTYLNFTLTNGRAVASSYHVFHGPDVDTQPVVRGSEATKLARQTLRKPSNTPITRSSLELRNIAGKLQLVWNVGVQNSPNYALVAANGDEQGRVYVIDDRVYENANGMVGGHVTTRGAPGSPTSEQASLGLPNIEVRAGDAKTTTDLGGVFAFDVLTGSTVDVTLHGRAATIVDQDLADLSMSVPAGVGLNLQMTDDTATEYQLAQTTAYYFVDASLTYLLDNGFKLSDIGEPLTTNVNINDACNAYFVPSERTINFFKSGSVGDFACNNSAEASIVAHEYGHFVDDVYGGIFDGGLSEGWGDLLACYLLDDEIVGGGLFTDGSIIRSCENDYQYPASGSDEVHALGQAWAGFAWQARKALIAQYGAVDGDAKARALFLPSLQTNSPDIPSSVREVILRDDDDGDIANQTPHWALLRAAADHHALGFVFDSDLIAPAAVSDLAVAEVTATTVTLSWTATGDDGIDGTATAYDLRVSAAPITDGTFGAATRIATADPLAAGSAQQLTVAATPETHLYYALRVQDEDGNTSGLSNMVEAETKQGVDLYFDGAEDGIGEWTTTGLWHVSERRAQAGTKSFWYGDEATGNYDNGATNSGELLSPVIVLDGAIRPVLIVDEYIDVESFAEYDQLTITVFDTNDPTIEFVIPKHTGTTGGEFVSRAVDLNGMEDRSIQIRFTFDTVDELFNDMEGWFVDNVRVIGDREPGADAILMINEVLADPALGYDANGDGYRHAVEDEFLEILNVGIEELDLSGATISDNVRTRYTFPEGTVIGIGEALLVFGGGTPAGFGVPVYTVGGQGLAMNNSGDTIRIHRKDGELLTEMTYGSEGGKDVSLVRETDGDHESPYIAHTLVGLDLASPGTKSNGRAFEPGRVIINEVLADPPVDYDANNDGVRHFHDDEFIEFVNIGISPVDLSGATISDLTGVRATIPDGTVLGPGQALLVFGGGEPTGFAGVHVVVDQRMFLNNDGDTVTITATDGSVIAEMSYGILGGQDMSLVRQIDSDPDAPFVLHGALSLDPASPGTRADGRPY